MGLDDFLQEGTIRISRGPLELNGTIPLTGSKSESNRALMLHILSKEKVNVINLSDADDTRLMSKALEQMRQLDELLDEPVVIDIGPAGTVMRFMTALLSISSGNFVLTGSERMKQRPIGLLVTALQQLGARISYLESPGFPPLSIEGGFEQGSAQVSIAGDVSSQYLSALLMIAPLLPQGLQLKIEGELTSRPYLTMTLNMLEKAGITYQWSGDIIRILPQKFQAGILSVEPDWSAASYWYSLLALSESGEIFLPGLQADSLQGDKAIAGIMEDFGIHSDFFEEGVWLRKEKPSTGKNSKAGKSSEEAPLLDFTECPDLAQTVIACAAALKKNMRFTGLHTLRIKETDRIAALQKEIAKFGAILNGEDSFYYLHTEGVFHPETLHFDTYEDHRMAMAFAPLAQVFDNVHIQTPKVVEKSYPDFWLHLQSMGLAVENREDPAFINPQKTTKS